MLKNHKRGTANLESSHEYSKMNLLNSGETGSNTQYLKSKYKKQSQTNILDQSQYLEHSKIDDKFEECRINKQILRSESINGIVY